MIKLIRQTKVKGEKFMISYDRKVKVALLSIISNSSLIIFKIIAGIISGSISIISEAIHSSMDLLASIIAFFSVKALKLPKGLSKYRDTESTMY